jgi:MFS family permease
MVNAARLLGPSLAGVLIAAFGEGWCFAVDAASYLAVIVSLLLMRITKREPPPQAKHVFAELQDGFRYVVRSRPIRAVLLLLATVSLTGVPYVVLLPVFAARVHGGGPHTLGFVTGASGLGAVAGALWLASRKSVVGLGRVLCVAGMLFGGGLVAFGLSRTLWLSMPALVIVGGGMMVQMAGSNTLIQTLVDEDKRGRVMSFWTMAFFGMAPFGSLAAGELGGAMGAPRTVILSGFATLLGVGLFAWQLPAIRREARSIYERKGLVAPQNPT